MASFLKLASPALDTRSHPAPITCYLSIHVFLRVLRPEIGKVESNSIFGYPSLRGVTASHAVSLLGQGNPDENMTWEHFKCGFFPGTSTFLNARQGCFVERTGYPAEAFGQDLSWHQCTKRLTYTSGWTLYLPQDRLKSQECLDTAQCLLPTHPFSICRGPRFPF